jgi:hypothetical protein
MKRKTKRRPQKRVRAVKVQLPAVVSPQAAAAQAASGAVPSPVAPVLAPIKLSTNVGQAVLKVQQGVGVIAKSGYNKFQDYKYPKWEVMLDTLSPLMAEAGLLLHQSEVERSVIERGAGGSVLAVVYDITPVHAQSGETWPPIRWTGMSRLMSKDGTLDDKAAAKCHTQAEKYACIKLFKIRTEEAMPDNDGEDIGRAPQARPDAMRRPSSRARSAAPAQSASPSNTPPDGGGVASTVSSPPSSGQSNAGIDPNSKPLDTIAKVQALEKEARMAAEMGSEAFAALWRRLRTHQEREVIKGLASELRGTMDAADARNTAAGADPHTGEIHDERSATTPAGSGPYPGA